MCSRTRGPAEGRVPAGPPHSPHFHIPHCSEHDFLQELAYYRTGLASLVKKSKYKAAMNARVVLQPGLESLQLPRDQELALEVMVVCSQ